jgi:hypothetical protein
MFQGRPFEYPEGMKPVMRNKAGPGKPRPKSMHEAALSRKAAAQSAAEYGSPAARGRRMGSTQDISGRLSFSCFKVFAAWFTLVLPGKQECSFYHAKLKSNQG